jgi:hypothetical protein
MKIGQLTAAISFSIFTLVACKKDNNVIERSNSDIVMNGAQISSTNASPAIGKLSVSYSSKTHLLTYTATWTGLNGTITAFRIHGPADPGFPGPVLQNNIAYSSSNTTGFPTSTSGTWTNSLYVDNVTIKEEDLLAGRYYVAIYTAGTYATTGEIRGQIVFD